MRSPISERKKRKGGVKFGGTYLSGFSSGVLTAGTEDLESAGVGAGSLVPSDTGFATLSISAKVGAGAGSAFSTFSSTALLSSCSEVFMDASFFFNLAIRAENLLAPRDCDCVRGFSGGLVDPTSADRGDSTELAAAGA